MTFSIAELTGRPGHHPIAAPYQVWIFLALFAGFAIKVPLFPLHTWLPLAHVQAPTAGSVILAGILLKIGTYGFRPLQHSHAARGHGHVRAVAVGAVGGRHHLRRAGGPGPKRHEAADRLFQRQPLGLLHAGPLRAQPSWACKGGVLQMINHGLSTGGLFAVVGMIYERYHTREIANSAGWPGARRCWLSFSCCSRSRASACRA